jgi:two-component system OmpR family sensor kinase
MEGMEVLRALPIRLRLTLAFAFAMALVLAATGAFVYLRMKSDLNASVDQGLRNRAGDVAALAGRGQRTLSESGGPLVETEESTAQVLSAGGTVVDAAPRVRSRPLLDRAELRRALRRSLFLERDRVPGIEGSARLLATPARVDGRPLVVVAGASLDDRDEALSNLLWLLALGGPAALLLASLAGYGVAAAALRPVESMRREAGAVSVTEPGRRLPEPAAEDEVGRLARTLNEMLARQEAAFARERAFVSDASHELRTPLAILRAELDLALRGGRTAAELEAALDSAAEEAERLTRLAEDLLLVARSDHGGLPVEPEPVGTVELLEGVRERFARGADQAGRGIRLEVDEESRLHADRARVEQALANLVENAMRHGAGEVVLATERRDGMVELHVRDDGPGFPEGFVERAFERFTRADPARGRGGTGLGLPIVAAIAAAHGGTAGARNRPQGGADVWLTLPAAPSASDGSSSPAHGRAIDRGES